MIRLSAFRRHRGWSSDTGSFGDWLRAASSSNYRLSLTAELILPFFRSWLTQWPGYLDLWLPPGYLLRRAARRFLVSFWTAELIVQSSSAFGKCLQCYWGQVRPRHLAHPSSSYQFPEFVHSISELNQSYWATRSTKRCCSGLLRSLVYQTQASFHWHRALFAGTQWLLRTILIERALSQDSCNLARWRRLRHHSQGW